MLLNSTQIAYLVGQTSFNQSPIFSKEKKRDGALLDSNQDVALVQTSAIKLTFIFYPTVTADDSLLQYNCTFFVQKIFNLFTERLLAMDVFSVTTLMNDLVLCGLNQSEQNKPHEALALYLMAQVVYCFWDADISFDAHLQMQYIFNLRINILNTLDDKNAKLERQKLDIWLSCLKTTLSLDEYNRICSVVEPHIVDKISRRFFFSNEVEDVEEMSPFEIAHKPT